MLGQVVHRFVRNPNVSSTAWHRVANRAKPFENTLTVLKDPQNNRELHLVGTTNSSTLLANRTKKLIEEQKPTTVYVQANQKWVELAEQIKGVQSQDELNQYNNELLKSYDDFKIENNPRGIMFKLRLYPWIAAINAIKGFPGDFHPFIPGLEMKYAVELAKQQNSNLILGGLAINDITLDALKVEKRMDVLPLIYRTFFGLPNTLWLNELRDNYNILSVHGGEAYAENMDKFRTNWFVKYFELIAPRQKKILVDKKDEEIFYSLYKESKGNKIVAVVNQWHVPGIEALWRHTTGTEIKQESINPVGDFDINESQENQLINDLLRDYTSKVTKSEPVTWANYITHYIKETTEYHRIRHISFNDCNDPHMYHGLPYGDHHHHEEVQKPAEIENKKQQKKSSAKEEKKK